MKSPYTSSILTRFATQDMTVPDEIRSDSAVAPLLPCGRAEISSLSRTPPARAAEIAWAIIEGIAAETENVFPDPMSSSLCGQWKQDHKAIERQFGACSLFRVGGAPLHARYDRCTHTFLSAIAFAAAFIFWINEP